MEQNGNYETLMTEMSEIRSQLETCGKEYLKLASELAHLTYTSSTNPTEGYQILRKHLDSQLEGLTYALKSLSLHLKNAQQSVALARSTSKNTTSGKDQEWLETWFDSWTTSLNSLSKMHQENWEKLSTQLKEKGLSA